MNKFFTKIIISAVMVAIFLAPVSLSFQKTNENILPVATNINSALAADPVPPSTSITITSTENTDDAGWGCSVNPLTWFRQCIVSMVFYLVFTPIAAITKIAGQILDFFIYYSTNSDSYSSGFIGSAWATVRDVSNIFFIIALLYVAIQTILGLGHGGKKMIATIVIVALLINFSMFFTQIIIDASNILAKVFYNHIESKGPNGEILPAGFAGEKSITVSLVDVFNPQHMLDAKKAEEPGLSFIVMIISIILMIYMIVIFLSVAMLFVGRVAGLWIAIIFAPLAFASYTMPFDLPGFGHKEWWSSLLKQAFMAPIFVFFLYVILLLGNSFKLISYDYTTSTDILGSLMAVIVPFMIVFVLIQQAKKLAVTYSGEMGAAFTKVGGFAMGAVGGAAGLALGAGVGSLAAKAAGNAGLQEKALEKGLGGFGARMALRTADYGSKASFDIRKSPVGDLMASQGMDLGKGTGMIGLGAEATAGGYKGSIERKQEKIVKGADLYKTKLSDAEVAAKYQKKYDDEKEAERNKPVGRGGIAFSEQAYEAIHGKGPAITTAAQLNKANLEAYKNNIGKNGPVYSAAASYVKKFSPVTGTDLAKAVGEYEGKDDKFKQSNPMPTLASLTEDKIKKTKLKIGLVAAAVAGPSGIAGLGWLGATVAGGGGLGAYGLHRITEGEAEKGAVKAVEKELKKGDKVEKLKADKKKLESVLEEYKETTKELTKEQIKEITGKEDGKITHEEYIAHKLIEAEEDLESAKGEAAHHRSARLALENNLGSASRTPAYGGTSEFERLNEQIEALQKKETAVKGRIFERTKEKFKLTAAKTATKEIETINTKIEGLESHAHPKGAADKGIPKPAAAEAHGGGDHGGGGHEDAGHDDGGHGGHGH